MEKQVGLAILFSEKTEHLAKNTEKPFLEFFFFKDNFFPDLMQSLHLRGTTAAYVSFLTISSHQGSCQQCPLCSSSKNGWDDFAHN